MQKVSAEKKFSRQNLPLLPEVASSHLFVRFKEKAPVTTGAFAVLNSLRQKGATCICEVAPLLCVESFPLSHHMADPAIIHYDAQQRCNAL